MLLKHESSGWSVFFIMDKINIYPGTGSDFSADEPSLMELGGIWSV